MPTYRTPPLALVRGEGSRVVDAEGQRYLDFLSGLAVTSLGHGHAGVAAAVAEQVATLSHASNLFASEPAVRLAERLVELAGWDDGRVFFANSGAEANEAAIKLARRHGLRQSEDKHRLVALDGSFHGRTLATLEATGQPSKHHRFAPLAGYVDHVAHDDPDALRSAVDERTCGVIVEVVQGEGGVRPVPDAVLLAAREACDAFGALLIVDEIQTGIGRTGRWFAWQDTAVLPDVMTLAKALGGGLPIGACVARGHAAVTFEPGDHASTFGGNPVTCAAALAVLDAIESGDLVAQAGLAGAHLRAGLSQLVGEVAYAAGTRGRGLLVALELDTPIAAGVEAECRDRGLLVNAVADDLIRLAPPLVVTDDEIEEALGILAAALKAVAEMRGGGA